MLKKHALKNVGGLSYTSKMPCPSWGTPPETCFKGGLYSTYKGSVCSNCYAKKGFNAFGSVRKARLRRLDKWKADRVLWVKSMITLIKGKPYFRWFDSGDIYSGEMFEDICGVCKFTPTTQHWLPTLERSIVLKHRNLIPNNLTVRFSSPFVNQLSSSSIFPVSMVYNQVPEDLVVICPAPWNDSKCGDCRYCWDKTRKVIAYREH